MDIKLQEFKFLNYQINSQIAEIIINRPPINAFNIRLLDEILSSLELAKNGFIEVKQNESFGNIFVKLKQL